MSQRQRDRRTCRTCKLHRDQVGPMTNSGQCRICGHAAFLENVRDLSNRTGPAFERWRRAMAASVGAVINERSDTTT